MTVALDFSAAPMLRGLVRFSTTTLSKNGPASSMSDLDTDPGNQGGVSFATVTNASKSHSLALVPEANSTDGPRIEPAQSAVFRIPGDIPDSLLFRAIGGDVEVHLGLYS